MSDDLVKHLREDDEFTFDPTQSKVNIGPINDPIYIGEEKPFGASVVQDIEAQLAEQIEWVKRLADGLIASEAKLAKDEQKPCRYPVMDCVFGVYLEELEVKLAKAVEELEDMQKVPRSDASHGILMVMIKHTLTELKG